MRDFHIKVGVPRGVGARFHETDNAIMYTRRPGAAQPLLGHRAPEWDWVVGRPGQAGRDIGAGARELADAAERIQRGIDDGSVNGHRGTTRSWSTRSMLSARPDVAMPEFGKLHVTGWTTRVQGGAHIDMSVPIWTREGRELLSLTKQASGRRLHAGLPTLGFGIAVAATAAFILAEPHLPKAAPSAGR